jgi:adenine/guanine/hypoxanthine permease
MSQPQVKNVNNSNSFLERKFKLSENGTTVKTEILAGITTFITMAYIIFVNPSILRSAGMNAAGAFGDDAAAFTALNDPVVGAVFVATALAAAVGSIIIGLYANLPYGLASGMGLNAFFTYSVVLTLGYTWQQALAAVFLGGSLFIVLSYTKVLDMIVTAIPQNLKLAISGGIGLFIALIGLKSGSIIVDNPATLVGFGSFTNPHALLTLIGIVITALLMARKVNGAILIGIIATTLIGIPLGITNIEGVKILSAPPSLAPTFMALDFQGLFGFEGKNFGAAFLSVIMVIITVSMVDLFDTVGTLVGTANRAGMIDKDGKPKNLNKGIRTSAIGAAIGALLGTSTVTTYVESSAGISQGGRTGLTGVVVGILFILSIFFGGLVGIVPAEATAPALVIVGILMMGAVKGINFEDFTEAAPAFLTIAIMPFSYSIANGIAAGLIFYPFVKLATGKHKEIHPIVYVLATLFILRFIFLAE